MLSLRQLEAWQCLIPSAAFEQPRKVGKKRSFKNWRNRWRQKNGEIHSKVHQMSPVKKNGWSWSVYSQWISEHAFHKFGVIKNSISRSVKTHHARGFVHICSMFMFVRVKSFGRAFGMAFFHMVGHCNFGSKLPGVTQFQSLFRVNRAGLRHRVFRPAYQHQDTPKVQYPKMSSKRIPEERLQAWKPAATSKMARLARCSRKLQPIWSPWLLHQLFPMDSRNLDTGDRCLALRSCSQDHAFPPRTGAQNLLGNATVAAHTFPQTIKLNGGTSDSGELPVWESAVVLVGPCWYKRTTGKGSSQTGSFRKWDDTWQDNPWQPIWGRSHSCQLACLFGMSIVIKRRKKQKIYKHITPAAAGPCAWCLNGGSLDQGKEGWRVSMRQRQNEMGSFIYQSCLGVLSSQNESVPKVYEYVVCWIRFRDCSISFSMVLFP